MNAEVLLTRRQRGRAVAVHIHGRRVGAARIVVARWPRKGPPPAQVRVELAETRRVRRP